jgi:hypothetical protein
MPEQVVNRADFLNKLFVDKNMKKLVESDLLWERLLAKQSINALNVRYYRERYVDIETPNDSAMSAPIDPFLKSPGYRRPGGTFPHTTFAEPSEYNLGLYQLALEVDIPDETQKYADLENMILKSQKKLGNSFASYVNNILGTKVTDAWATASSVIQHVTISAGKEWSNDPTTSGVQPVQNVIAAQELIDDISGYAYKPDGMLVSKQSYYDLRAWMAYNDYQLKETKIGPETTVDTIEGLPLYVSNMVKRDFAVVGDFKAAGVLYESEPVNTKQYYTDKDRTSHIQISRTFNYALTDGKAICTILNTVA